MNREIALFSKSMGTAPKQKEVYWSKIKLSLPYMTRLCVSICLMGSSVIEENMQDVYQYIQKCT